jgi:hypothetical protein
LIAATYFTCDEMRKVFGDEENMAAEKLQLSGEEWKKIEELVKG